MARAILIIFIVVLLAFILGSSGCGLLLGTAGGVTAVAVSTVAAGVGAIAGVFGVVIGLVAGLASLVLPVIIIALLIVGVLKLMGSW
ncbi:MAG TPA: hypothetical protein VMY05_08105 [Acidobacteriota bacterium]|nr:hypothetical protein [Acidobacteriota bacterium]